MGIEATLTTPLARAVRAVGSQSAYARLTKQSQGNVHRALSSGGLIRPEDVRPVSEATGIPKDELRPDLFGDASPIVSIDRPTGGRA